MARLRRDFGPGSTGHKDEEVDLRVNVDRARVRVATHSLQGQALPGSARWRRLGLLADTESLRWLRQPRGAAYHPATPARKTAQIRATDE